MHTYQVSVRAKVNGRSQVSEKLMSDAFSGLGLVMLVVFLVLSWILSKKLEHIAEQS